MASISSFNPLSPNPLYADQLVFTKPQAESVSGDYNKEGSLKPLKTLLETGARSRPETPEGQEMAYQDIKETLQNLLANDQLHKEKEKGIYVYEVAQKNYCGTGIWALTDLSDYTEGAIKIHELTFADSVRRLKNYREHTGLEGSPVLLTYPPDGTVNAIIAMTKARPPKAIFANGHGRHRLWKIEDTALHQALIAAFVRIKTTYTADGHHRLASAAELAAEQRKKGLAAYDSLSTLYMDTDQLQIEEYDRVVVPDRPVQKEELFRFLQQHFYIRESAGNRPVQPKELHRMGMYMDGQWYHLLAKSLTYDSKVAAAGFDATILQERVLSPIFGIHDPKTDSRLKCAGGEKALEELGTIFHAHPGAIAFTLCPLTAEELISVADAGLTLPPKSTWIVPKVPYGLLMYHHDQSLKQ